MPAPTPTIARQDVKPCRTGLPHARPCGPHPSGDSFCCACGCSGDELWCVADDGPLGPEEKVEAHGWTAELDWNDQVAWFALTHTSGATLRFDGGAILAANAESCFAACVADAAALHELRRQAAVAFDADPEGRLLIVERIVATLLAEEGSHGTG